MGCAGLGVGRAVRKGETRLRPGPRLGAALTSPEGENMGELIAQLDAAKVNVRWLLDHESGLADMHGLKYWAGEVERLRDRIREAL